MEPEKIYAIRHLSYSYNDEYFSSYLYERWHQGHMAALFENKEAAIQEWKQLEYKFSHKVNFQNIIECSQQHDFYGKEKILAQMSVDELFNILNQLDNCVYAVFEYPKQLKQQVFFDIYQNEYRVCYGTTEYDIQENNFLQANFIENDHLLSAVSPSASSAIYRDIELVGSLADFSDSPLLLERLIQDHPDIKYNHSCLVIKPNALSSINPLLKNPIEMRYLTIEEIYQLEKSLNQA
ncbi:hypothetical protein [Acinetobacter genomosp. 15BJ]|uniref:Uncharacterized protein n=1 Tax=Acinetobacter genomosp. 15BJ TaxID=106651 RepID=R9B5L7_9GAMM|nr:hypothetical protein [Acinetobacter genomosp. 15BJ]EOR09580.1 hypothetical protein F896_00601 [Acinetobacter genomosp. 15BJ]MCH7293004.1 hypothetical protein [Acinetobacter genomosp. 15BJ]MDO3659122.1 hypothetical protein [Acinetobacter genomosp. 15BJ]